MHAVLVTVGTDGDILPYVGLGAVLRARGHRITFVASEHYGPLAQRHGFVFHPLVSTEENDELFNHPDCWNPLKTAPLAARWAVRFIRRQYELLSKLVTPDTVLVANPGVLAASLVHEEFDVPWTNLVLQPWMIPSSIAPSLMPKLTFLARAPRLVWKIFWRALDFAGDILVGRELNRLRGSIGLQPVGRLFQNWFSKQLVIGMFPEWYGQPQADWPSQIQLVGFPMFDGAPNEMLPSEVSEFIRAGEPPVAFTFGTGMAHSKVLFRAALEACELLSVRGILLTKYRNQLPESLPPSVLHCAFAPFQQLFPRCAAVVHHGGVGTVAQAFAAGIPQLVHPICFDQMDNGARVQRIGAGDFLRTKRASGKQIATALAALMNDEVRARCRVVATRFHQRDSLKAAADWVESMGVNPGG